jgi:hypothetical protein
MQDCAITFNNIWESVPTLNSIPSSVYSEINILTGASQEFLNLLCELEQTADFKARGQKALKYLNDNNGLLEIDYETLGKYLRNPALVPIPIWRQLYVLERSIPPRFGGRYTWVQRLKMFYNTYLYEQALQKHSFIWDGKKFVLRLITGRPDRPIYHDRLVAGEGKWGADFYIYDNKMLFVEHKYCDKATVAEAAEKYDPSQNKYTYAASFVVVYMAKLNAYYLINYAKYLNGEQDYSLKLTATPPTNTFSLDY